MKRQRPTRSLSVGGVAVGGGAPVSVQTMANVDPHDVEALVRQTIEVAPETGRDYLPVAFGCYGGHHRSVYLAERFAERLAGTDGIEIEVTHTARQYWNA